MFEKRIAFLSRRERDSMEITEHEESHEQLVKDLKQAIEDYFPGFSDFFEFATPDDFSRESDHDFLRQSDHDFLGDSFYKNKTGSVQKDSVFLAAVAIRYVDNFIDKVLWPRIHDFEPAVLEKLYEGFLQRVYTITQVYDTNMPEEIIELPRLELSLELHPTQDMFDKHIEELVKRKSIDMAYLTQLKIGGQRLDVEQPTKYMMLALEDYSRDFAKDSGYNNDFDLKRFISNHRIDPWKLINLIEETLKQNGYTYTNGNWMKDFQFDHTQTLFSLQEMYKILKRTQPLNSVDRMES